MHMQAAVQELNQIRLDVAAKTQRYDTIVRDLATIPAGYDATRHRAVRATECLPSWLADYVFVYRLQLAPDETRGA